MLVRKCRFMYLLFGKLNLLLSHHNPLSLFQQPLWQSWLIANTRQGAMIALNKSVCSCGDSNPRTPEFYFFYHRYTSSAVDSTGKPDRFCCCNVLRSQSKSLSCLYDVVFLEKSIYVILYSFCLLDRLILVR